MQSNYTQFQMAIIKRAFICALLVASFSLFFSMESVAKGFTLGTIFSVVNFKMMAISVSQRLARQKKGLTLEAILSSWLRYGLLAVPVIVAAKVPQIDLVSTIVGLFSVLFSIYLYFLLELKVTKEETLNPTT